MLEVEVYDWPDSFLVEAENPCRDYQEFFGKTKEVWPHYVDLSVYETGWCSCRDFRINVEPFLFLDEPSRRECIHITAAQKFLVNHKTRPLLMPCPANLFPVPSAEPQSSATSST